MADKTQEHIETGFTYTEAMEAAGARVATVNEQKLHLQAELTLAFVAAFAGSDDKAPKVTAKRIKPAMLELLATMEGLGKSSCYNYASAAVQIGESMIANGADMTGTLESLRASMVADWKAEGLTVTKVWDAYKAPKRGAAARADKSDADKLRERVEKDVSEGKVDPADVPTTFEAIINALESDALTLDQLDAVLTAADASATRIMEAEQAGEAEATAEAA